MDKLLITLDTDIQRCEDVLKLNNYLEIVIAVEEIIDKYKDKIEGMNIGNDRVWDYSKKDLENILDKLKIERNSIITKYTESQIDKRNNLDEVYYNIKTEIVNNESLLEDKFNDILCTIENIYNIGKKSIDLETKWFNLKEYINKASNEDLFVGSKIILLINTIIKN